MKKVSPEIQKKAKNAYVVCANCGKEHGRMGSVWEKIKIGRCDICHKRTEVVDFKAYGFAKY